MLARSLCASHYQKFWREGKINNFSRNTIKREGSCQIVGCEEPIAYSGFCNKHNKRLKKHGDPDVNLLQKKRQGPCSILNCGKPIEIGSCCKIHYDRLRRTGQTERRIAEAGSWQLDIHGYLTSTRNSRRVYQHRYVVELVLGKRLRWGAEVHHLNGDKTDNRPWNLVVCPDREYHILIAARQKQFNYAGPQRLNQARGEN